MIKNVSIFLFFTCLFVACNNPAGNVSTQDSGLNTSNNIGVTRETVHPNPVKIYTEVSKSFETTDTLKVQLFETKDTYNYLIKINYKQLDAEDTLRIPDFNEKPQPSIQKGDKRPSCIIGFLDKDNQFRESKLVYFEDNTIKVHVLKYYGVSSQ